MLKHLRRSRLALIGVCCVLVGAAVVPVVGLAGSITGSTGDGPMIVQSGEYVPAYAGVRNVASFPTSNYKAIWTRVGDTVHVTGTFVIRATAAPLATEVYLPLPVPSNISTYPNCAGTVTVNYDALQTYSPGQVIGSPDAGHTDQCFLGFTTASTNTGYVHYSYSYRVKD